MIKCKKCNVYINTNVKTCPLCKNKLEEKDEKKGTYNAFPTITPIAQNGLWKKGLGVSFTIISLICVFIDFVINHGITWSAYVVASFACITLSIVIAVYQKKSLSNVLFFEYIFLCLIFNYWDRITNYSAWSIDYALPIFSTFFSLLSCVLRFNFKRDFKRYYRNMAFSSVIGIICFILTFFDIIHALVPSYVSGIVCAIIFIGITIFDGKEVFLELTRRLHV